MAIDAEIPYQNQVILFPVGMISFGENISEEGAELFRAIREDAELWRILYPNSSLESMLKQIQADFIKKFFILVSHPSSS